MIQRIQSVYLLLGALCLGSLFFLSSPWASDAAEAFAWFEPALLALSIGGAVGAVGSVFLYANRPLQRQAVVVVQVLTLLFAAVEYGGLYVANDIGVRAPDGALLTEKVAALAVPIVAYVFFLLARRSIDNDIELVKSMDRLR